MIYIYLSLVLMASTLATWFGGVYLSRSTEQLSREWKVDQSLAGMAILAVITNLPECAIATHAAIIGQAGLLVGNVLGGIATQMVVLALLDWRTKGSLTTEAAHPSLVWQSIGLIAVLVLALSGIRLAPSGFPYFELALLVGWLFVVAWLYLQRDTPAANESPEPAIRHVYWVFAGSSALTFVGGLFLAVSVESLAERLHLDSMLMGATVLAFLTALPEISSALGAIRLKAYRLAISDVIGGNLFMPALLFPVSLILGGSVLAHAEPTDFYFTSLALGITVIYTIGLAKRQRARVLGLDSLAAIGVYTAGTIVAIFWR